MSVSEAAKKGGNKTLENHGSGHYKKIAKDRWKETKKKKKTDTKTK